MLLHFCACILGDDFIARGRTDQSGGLNIAVHPLFVRFVAPHQVPQGKEKRLP